MNYCGKRSIEENQFLRAEYITIYKYFFSIQKNQINIESNNGLIGQSKIFLDRHVPRVNITFVVF